MWFSSGNIPRTAPHGVRCGLQNGSISQKWHGPHTAANVKLLILSFRARKCVREGWSVGGCVAGSSGADDCALGLGGICVWDCML